MIIILEGPDGAGKTTLAEQLRQRYGFEVHHEGPPPAGTSQLTHYVSLLQNAHQRTRFARKETIVPGSSSASDDSLTSPGTVFDRLALGERVYGPIYRNDTSFGLHEWHVFQTFVVAAHALEIMCLPPYEVCRDNWASRKEREMVKDEPVFRKVWDAYNDFLNKEQNQYHYDFTRSHSLDELCRFVELQLRRERK